ncbi:unnamed protein product [Linum trigynum]|uniref:Uncharacterized protein n=1 Tax=Linum trigynum TaxID=586398 RepID=A0AAV2DYF3_9ROSI
MGIYEELGVELEVDSLQSFDFRRAFKRYFLLKNRETKFDPTRTMATTLLPQWLIITTILAHSIFPSYMSTNKITKRALLAFTSMVDPNHRLHLGSVLAASFSKV